MALFPKKVLLPGNGKGMIRGDANQARTLVKHSFQAGVLPGAWVTALGCGLGPVGGGGQGC